MSNTIVFSPIGRWGRGSPLHLACGPPPTPSPTGSSVIAKVPVSLSPKLPCCWRGAPGYSTLDATFPTIPSSCHTRLLRRGTRPANSELPFTATACALSINPLPGDVSFQSVSPETWPRPPVAYAPLCIIHTPGSLLWQTGKSAAKVCRIFSIHPSATDWPSKEHWA